MQRSVKIANALGKEQLVNGRPGDVRVMMIVMVMVMVLVVMVVMMMVVGHSK